MDSIPELRRLTGQEWIKSNFDTLFYVNRIPVREHSPSTLTLVNRNINFYLLISLYMFKPKNYFLLKIFGLSLKTSNFPVHLNVVANAINFSLIQCKNTWFRFFMLNPLLTSWLKHLMTYLLQCLLVYLFFKCRYLMLNFITKKKDNDINIKITLLELYSE